MTHARFALVFLLLAGCSAAEAEPIEEEGAAGGGGSAGSLPPPAPSTCTTLGQKKACEVEGRSGFETCAAREGDARFRDWGACEVDPDAPPPETPGPREGDACAAAGELACPDDADDAAYSLRCAAGRWTLHETCEPGAFCNPAGEEIRGACLPAVAACDGVPPNRGACEGQALYYCSGAGLGLLAKTCDVGQVCDPVGAQCDACEAGELSCGSNGWVYRCSATGQTNAPVTQCGGGSYCLKGHCQPY